MSGTQKISLLGAFLLALFAFSLVSPAEAQVRSMQSRSDSNSIMNRMQDRMASSSNRMSDRAGSSTPKVNAVCMQTTVDTREEAISSAWLTYSTAMVEAIEDRQTALYAAWGLSDAKARGAAIKKAAMEWKADHKKAHMDLRKSRVTAWTDFKKTAKDTCRITLPKEESLGKDTVGTIQI